MDALNYVGGSFDDPNCEQYYNELAANGLHLANCPNPWDLLEVCSHCCTPDQLDEVQRLASGLHGNEQRTYAQVVAWSSEYDAAWVPLAEPVPAGRPRAMAVADPYVMVPHSSYRQRIVDPQHRGQERYVDDTLAKGTAAPLSRRETPTYAEAVQHMHRQSSPAHGHFGSHSLFTSTENSLGLPHQKIYRAPQRPPHRTIRTQTPQVAPYFVPQRRRHLPDEIYIPTLTQPENSPDPRDPYTLVQRTGRGGHREPVSSAFSSSGASSPRSCGTLSTTSTATRARRKGNAMKDPTLPFSCSDCGSTYSVKDNLTRHIRRTHLGVQERPHPCSVPNCAWKFVNPKDLKRHEKTHAPNATPGFQCPHSFCMKSYTRNDNLARHIRAEHASDSGLGTSRSNSECVGLSRSNSSFSQKCC